MNNQPVSKCLGLVISASPRFFVAFIILFAGSALADPWINPGDERTRHHIQVLSDAGKLPIPVTAWPLMWADVRRHMEDINYEDLSNGELWSYRYLRHAIERAMAGAKLEVSLYGSNSISPITEFASDTREKEEARVSATFMTDRLAINLEGSYVADPLDGERARYDGSYVAGTMGNWVIGLGAIDRYWGPGWQSSLILSHNARPAPGVFLQRKTSEPFSWPVLKYLGPWQVTAFANQLEEERYVPNAKLLGARVSLKPFKPFEIGFSRTAQWGGDGKDGRPDRPEDLRSFWNMLIGNDSRGMDGIAGDTSNEPGNQLGGWDWRYNFAFKGIQFALFKQDIGEDEQNYLPFQFIRSHGGEIAWANSFMHSRIAFETSNTATRALNQGKSNVAYEHAVYQSGYRHYGLPIGHTTDNDSKMRALNGFHFFSNGHQINWSAAKMELNRDGLDKPAPGGSAYGTEIIDQKYFDIEYKFPVSKNILASVSAFYYENPMTVLGTEVDSGGRLGLTLVLP